VRTLAIVVPLTSAVLLWVVPAGADVSSWLYFGGGPSFTQHEQGSRYEQPTLQMEAGLGTPPADTVIFGGLYRVHTHFGQGTDLGLMLRTATHGFVNGDWGGGVDFGGYQRWWGVGSSGLQGALVLGAPWGITLSAGAGAGTNDARHYTATIGIDFARLTIYRRTGDSWWKNPFPAYRPEEGPGR
jgi:hypothetical protein